MRPPSSSSRNRAAFISRGAAVAPGAGHRGGSFHAFLLIALLATSAPSLAGQSLLNPHVAVLKVDAALAEAHRGLGVAYIGKGDLARAADEFRECIRIDGRDAEARSNLGLVLLRMGKRREAVDTLRAALEIAPSSARNHYRLGTALAVTGDAQSAAQ